MLPSALMLKMFTLLPADHQTWFFLSGAFLKRLPNDVRAHLVNEQTSDPLSLVLHAFNIYQSRISSASAMSPLPLMSAQFLPFVCSSCLLSHFQHSHTLGPCPRQFQTPSSASHRSNSPSLYWYHLNHAGQAQKCCVPCSWSGN